MKKLTVDAKVEKLDEVMAFVEGELEEGGASMKEIMAITLAVEEVFVNIAHYAYEGGDDGEGEAVISMEFAETPKSVTITFADWGRPYNPLEREDPDITLSAEERSIGGLGIFLVKKNMDEVSYEYRDGMNVLTTKKNLL